ncbi:hypothetical protein Tco_1174988 [Tanacetum coccineum]
MRRIVNHYTDAKDIWDNVKMLLEGSELTKEDRESQLYDDFEHFCQNKGETIHDYYVRFAKLINDMRNIKIDNVPKYSELKSLLLYQNVQGRQNKGHGNNARGTRAAGYGGAQTEWGMLIQNTAYFKDKYVLMQAQENGVVLDEEQLLFLAGGHDNAIDEDVDEQPVQDLALNVDNVFQADDCDAYDSDVDEAPHDTNYDAICEHHEEHGMQDDVQPSYVVGSHADYTSDSNMTPYDQYVKDNAVPVVQNNASTVPNDMYVMIDNDLHEPKAQSVFKAPTYTVADNSLNAELAI